MADVFTPASHTDGNHLTAMLENNSESDQAHNGGQTRRDASGKAPGDARNADGHNMPPAGPPARKRTRGSNKRALGDIEEEDASREAAQGPQRKKAKVVPSEAAAETSRTRAPRTRALKARSASGPATTTTRGVKRPLRSSRVRRTAAPPPPKASSSSAGGSGVNLSLNKSATGPERTRKGNRSRAGHEDEHDAELNMPAGGSHSVHVITSNQLAGAGTGDVRSHRDGPATHAHMTRARTRASLESASASSSTAPSFLFDPRASSATSEDSGVVNPGDAAGPTEAPERQDSPTEGMKEAQIARGRRHMNRSGTNQPVRASIYFLPRRSWGTSNAHGIAFNLESFHIVYASFTCFDIRFPSCPVGRRAAFISGYFRHCSSALLKRPHTHGHS